jgi:hypothetical protein
MTLLERKRKIKELHKNIEKLNEEIREIVRPYIDDVWLNNFQYICIPFWDCPESPVGWCVYNNTTDSAHDNCIFCNQPLDRK